MAVIETVQIEVPDEVRPQVGPQEAFLASPADIVIYGGAAGGGKSYGLLLEPLRHIKTNPGFNTVIFRKNLTDAKKPGATWDQSIRMYGPQGAKPRTDNLSWQFPDGGKIVIGHLESETTVLDWQSSEIALIEFDELTHFSRAQFFYMLSRNRSMCGVRPYVRASTNPDADSWVAELIAWWIDQVTGFPIPERSGVIRWFINVNDVLIWADSAEELLRTHGNPDLPDDHFEQIRPKSLTFISAKLTDNPILMQADPGYLANLKALSIVERGRLLGGNWKIRPSAGLMFRRDWCPVIKELPPSCQFVRHWDLAATPKTEKNDPDWTVGFKMARYFREGKPRFVMCGVKRMRDTAGKVSSAIKIHAEDDGHNCHISLPQDPGQAGKGQVEDFISLLAGYAVHAKPETGDKVVRFTPFSAQCEHGNVEILEGTIPEETLAMLEAFPTPNVHDDDADAAAGAFNFLCSIGGEFREEDVFIGQKLSAGSEFATNVGGETSDEGDVIMELESAGRPWV